MSGPTSPSLDPPKPARRSLVIFALVAFGFLAARHAPSIGSILWFSAAAVILAISLPARGWICRALLAAAVVWLASGWFQLRINERPSDSLAAFISDDPLAEPPLASVRGLVTETPRESSPDAALIVTTRREPQAVVFELDVNQVSTEKGMVDARGRVRVRIEGPLTRLPAFVHAGAMIELTGRLRSVRGPMNPGEPPRDLLAAQSGLVGSLSLDSPDSLKPSQHDGPLGRARGQVIALREGLHSAVLRTVLGDANTNSKPSHGRALAAAMLLGERDPALADVESSFRRVGLIHLVAISGFNLAVLAWLALVMVRLTGDRGWVEPIVCALVVLLYLVVLPGESSILRSGIGLLVLLVAESSGRRYDRLTLLGWVAVALLIATPMDLWSLGYQLSFGVVAALLWLAPRVHDRLWGVPIRGLVPTPTQRTNWYRLLVWCASNIKLAITASLVAWAVATPLIAHHTGLVSPISPLASLIVTPAAAVILWIGYACILLGLIAPGVAEHTSSLLSHLGDAAVWIVTRIDEWPGACIYLPRLSALWAAGATVVVIYWLWRGHLRDWPAWAATLLVCGWLAAATTIGTRLDQRAVARLDVLAMGDGSCVLLRSGREAVLIGAGTSGAWPRAEDVRRAVRELGAWHVRTIVVPGNEPEFWSLVPDLVEPLGVRTLIVGEGFTAAGADPANDEARVLRTVDDLGVQSRVVVGGDAFALGSATVRVVGRSQSSMILRVEAGQSSVLLAQAATHTQVQALRPGDRNAAVLVLPMRSSAGDRPDQTIASVGARTAILSSGIVEARNMARTAPGHRVGMTAKGGLVGIEVGGDGSVRAP